MNERAKRDSDGLAVRQRIIDIYQHTGFAGIDPGDLRGRFRWYGLYTQRRQGIAGGKTGDPRTRGARGRVLHDADPHRRRRPDERAVARDRRDLHDVRPRRRRHHRPAERPAALDPDRGRPRDLGAARGGRPVHDRGVRRHPASCSAARSPASTPTRSSTPGRRCGTTDGSSGDPAFSNLPRKFKTSISGCARHCTNHEINDVSFVGVIGPDGTPASTSGSAAACRPTRCSPSASACSCDPTRSARSGPASRRSSATTATGGRATTRG